MGSDIVLYIVVATALAFDFTNGFHDTANAIATSISTRAMSPRAAVLMSAVLNFAGAFISLEVAATVAKGIVEAEAVTPTIVFGGLIGAIAWNLATWWFGLPSSSSHALFGGLVGATLCAVLFGVGGHVLWGGLFKSVIIPMVVSPLVGFVLGAIISPPDAVAPLYFNARKVSIYGGSNEIQRNIIAERVLGLPKDAGVDKNVPFNQLKLSK